MNMTKSMWWILGGIGLAGVGISGYYLFRHSKKQKASGIPGISNSPKTPGSNPVNNRAIPVTQPNWKAPFDMNYITDVKKWLGGKKIIELSSEAALRFAAQLKNAKGVFDDEDAVDRVFKSLKDKTQVATISKAFYFNYGRQDLWQYLRSFLSDSEMERYVLKHIRKLDNYRTAV